MKLHVKKGDTVLVISGDDRGKKGKVLEVSPKEGKIIVEGLNMVKKHVKPHKMGDQGGIVEAEGAMYACKVQLYCPKCEKGIRPSVTYKVDKDGIKTKVRTCKCGHEFE